VGAYCPGDEPYLYNPNATDTQKCCVPGYGQGWAAAGCVTGDVAIAGPAVQGLWGGTTLLTIQHFTTNYTKDGQPWKIANIPANVYIDGNLVESGIVWGYPEGGDASTNLSSFENGTYTLRYFGLGDVNGRALRIVIDPDNNVIETNKGNNTFEGIVQ
jgi:hypothetical protein